jgi:hypothetical protein
MPFSDPFSAPGRWYRACLHAHTTNSDGTMPADSLVRHYRTAGFDALTITDHWHVTDASARSTEQFLVLPGIEYNARGPDVGARRFYHVVGIGVESAEESANEPSAFVEAIHAQRGVAILAHPSWSGLAGSDLSPIGAADAVEVWNAGCELEVARGDSSVQWDAALVAGARFGGVASDDSHYPGFDSAHAWVAARLPELTREALLASLRERRYYASCGPSIHAVEAEGNTVRVRCSAVQAINVVSHPPIGVGLVAGRMGLATQAERLRGDDSWAEGTLDNAGLTGGVFHLPPYAPWFRVVVTDGFGRRAWTNPLWRGSDGWMP